jgi:hypothetical protein
VRRANEKPEQIEAGDRLGPILRPILRPGRSIDRIEDDTSRLAVRWIRDEEGAYLHTHENLLGFPSRPWFIYSSLRTMHLLQFLHVTDDDDRYQDVAGI